MEISEFVFRLILIFTPGLIAFFLVKQLTIHEKYKFYEEVIHSFLLGLISYFFYFLITRLPWFKTSVFLITNLTDAQSKPDLREILWVSFISVFVGLGSSYAISHTWLHRFAQKFGISRKFGDLSVFDHVMNSKNPPWVIIRDLKNDLCFEGWIEVFPDETEENGIYLRDVIVFKNSTGAQLYTSPGIYLERDRKDLIYDFPTLTYTEAMKRGEK